MKHLLFFLLFFNSVLFAQNSLSINDKVKNYPKLVSNTSLANKISQDFDSDKDKIRALFTWLALNIKYDLNELYNPKQKRIRFSYKNEEDKLAKIKAIKENIVKETLLNRNAVCEGFAQTFSNICSLMNIENEVLKGYVRNSSYDIGVIKNQTNHAWNAVKINDKWIYIDATWAAGAVINGKWQRNFNEYYFDIPKEKYFRTHFPEDKLWQLRIGSMDIADYFNQPIYNSVFLNSSIELVKPLKGIITPKNNKVEIQLKNLQSDDRVMCGFLGYRYAQKPTTSKNGNITTIRVTPPTKAKELFLIINGAVVLEFLIK